MSLVKIAEMALGNESGEVKNKVIFSIVLSIILAIVDDDGENKRSARYAQN